ncbi:MAG: helicase-exonuclease AddAB subunit AddA [Lachnospiraceae bacterium]|nr:helicase-exonuclease AddAB subunit AddA [Lachnospiraceae bacterium]
MPITYSEDQLKVINSRGRNLIVSAAAGAGKTSVLVRRIIERITDKENPIDINRILVVTFTRAAAGEMKERIAAALEEELTKFPEDGHLQRQATLVHNANITTIDSFCLDVLKNNFHKIGVDPSFRVAGEGETDLLKADAMENVMTSAYEKNDPEFFNLIDCYVKKDKDTNVEDNIKSLYNFAMSYPWPEDWLKGCFKAYELNSPEEFEESELLKRVCDVAKDVFKNADVLLERLYDVITTPGGPEIYEPTHEELCKLSEEAQAIFEKRDYVKASEFMASHSVPQFSMKNDESDPVLKETAKELRKAYKDKIDALNKAFFGISVKEQYDAMRTAGRTVKVLTELTIDFMKEFERLKRERSVIDFTDMEHMAVKILIEDYKGLNEYKVTDVAKEYRQMFDEVMIDEYQDSNLVQEIILAAVSHQGTDLIDNRFMVGDKKQSIYRFRLARPQIFTAKEKEYKENPDSSEVIYLKENYRSRKEVVDSVNKVFKDIMCEEYGGSAYTDDEALYARAEFPEAEGYKTKIILTENYGKTVKYARKWEAEELVRLIDSLVGHKLVYDKDKKEMRKASYKDIAVLMGTPTKWTKDISEALSDHSIPFHLEGVGTFYESQEISDIINFLRIIDNPLNDIALYATMTSYFGGFDDEYMAYIKGEGEKSEFYLWDKVIGRLSRHPDDERLKKFTDLVKVYRDLSIYTPIGELINRLVTDTGFLLYESASRNGKLREANIELLIKKASDYAKTSFSGIFHFLRYVELLKKTGVEEGEAGIFDENSDTVRVMSIHKSKGLEFPICIVAAIEDAFITKDQSGEFVLDIDDGIGADAIDPEKRVKSATIKRKLIKNKIALESLGEEIRLLYVAMTRAKEQLILLGSVKDAGTFFENPSILKPNSFLNLLKAPVMKNGFEFFEVTAVDPKDFELTDTAKVFDVKNARAELENYKADDRLSDDIKAFITFEYPYKNLEKLYTKTTVSNLKMEAMEEVQGETEKLFAERERSEYVPVFAGGGVTVSGTDRGTAYHTLLRLLDFTKLPSEKEWRGQLEAAVEIGKTTKEEVALVNFSKLSAFASDDMAMRMHKAAVSGRLYKEQPFVMGVPAIRVDPAFPEDETVLVQGVIDVFFYEGDEIVVLDYKTDRVDTLGELSERYKAQLDYYAEALQNLTGKKVKEKALYSFALNSSVSVS